MAFELDLELAFHPDSLPWATITAAAVEHLLVLQGSVRGAE